MYAGSSGTDEGALEYVRRLCNEAKERSLRDFLETALGVESRSYGSYVRMDSCPNARCGASHKGSGKLRIDHDRDWYCFQCGEHGTIVDAAMRLYADCPTPVRAARYILTGDSRPAVSQEQVRQQREEDLVRKKWAAWAMKRIHEGSRDRFDRDVFRFLTATRGIDPRLVQEAWRRGVLAGLPATREAASQWLRSVVGEDALRYGGLWKEDAPHPWIAGRPLVQFVDNRECAEFRILFKPTNPNVKKTLTSGMPGTPFYWEGEDASRCLVVEGCLEMLAALSMGYAGSVIATAGTGSWNLEWFRGLAKAGVSTFDLAFNNDANSANGRNAGQIAQAELAAELVKEGFATCDASPVEPGDINDALLRKQVKRASM